MTHCAGYRAAAVASARAFAAIGIDAEPNQALPEGVLPQIARPAERACIARRAGSQAKPAVHWDRLLFSAKESVFKAWYPVTRQELEFDEAEVTFDERGGFEARLLVPGPVAGYRGRWLARDGLLLTAIALAAEDRAGD
jgi:4'-phosphopantetheinyl transferase EntD